MLNLSATDKAFDAYRYAKEKVMVFVLPGIVRQGTQTAEIRFPFKGKLTEIYANLGKVGSTSTEIRIQKLSQNLVDDGPSNVWNDILSSNVIVEGNEKSSNTSVDSHIINIDTVNRDDHYRVIVHQAGLGSEQLTIELKVKLI